MNGAAYRARIGVTFLGLYRSESEGWQLSKCFTRPDLPETLQVGLNAYSSSEVGGEADGCGG